MTYSDDSLDINKYLVDKNKKRRNVIELMRQQHQQRQDSKKKGRNSKKGGKGSKGGRGFKDGSRDPRGSRRSGKHSRKMSKRK